MDSAEKELENRIQEVGGRLVSPPSDIDQLLALLDQTESLLSRVDQSPSQSMSTALGPATKLLVSSELLEHPDIDVKVAVASCISEITRITAPDAPYDDDRMKVIFQMIVEAFRKLDDTSSRSYNKRLLILETVAKVRSCVVMLDLECDSLILEMFHHFLNSIRAHHPENVFTSMETIMTLVLEESEDISSELRSCLLDSVKKDNEVLPIARKLGEKVITNCAAKLKPYLMEVVQSLCAREYSKIIAAICQENSNSLEHTEINVSGENLADDSKLSERTVSDELPQESMMLGQEVASPKKVGSTDKSPRLMTSNGDVQSGNGEPVVEPTSPKQKPESSRCSGPQKSSMASDKSNLDKLESEDVKSENTLDVISNKTRGRKGNKSVKGTDASDHSENDGDKEALPLSSRTEGSKTEAESSKVDPPSCKEAEPDPGEENRLQPTDRSDNGIVSVSSPIPSQIVQDTSQPKRVRPPRSKGSVKKGANTVADQPASPSEEKGSQMKNEELPTEDNKSNENTVFHSSAGKSLKRSGKKIHSRNVDDVAQTSIKSVLEGKTAGRKGKKGTKENIIERDSSEKQEKSNIKQKEIQMKNEELPTEENVDDVAQTSVKSDLEGKTAGRKGKKGTKENIIKKDSSEKQEKSNIKQKESQMKNEELPTEDNRSNEDTIIHNSAGKSLERSGKKIHSRNVVDVTQTSVKSDLEGKPAGRKGKKGTKENIMEINSSEEQENSNIKQPKKKITHGKNAVGDLSLKDELSLPISDTKTQSKEENLLEDSTRTVKTATRRKRPRDTVKVSEKPATSDNKQKLDLDLVGSKIRVWWPDDKKYYSGKVEQFYSNSGMHKIVYDDGDEEKLLLKDEDYELVEGGKQTEGGQTKGDPSSSAASDGPRRKKLKATPDSGSKQATAKDTPLKSGTESVKRKGRPKGSPNKPKIETPKTGSTRLRGSGGKVEDETPNKSDMDPKDASPRPGRRTKDDGTPKVSGKAKDDSLKSGKSKDVADEGIGKSTVKGKAKAYDGTPPKAMGRPKSKGGATPKTSGGASVKGKTKVKDQETLEQQGSKATSTGKAKAKDTETPGQQGSKATSTGKSIVKDKETPGQHGSKATSTGKAKVKDTKTPEQQGSKATSTGKSKVKDKETPKQQGSKATSTGRAKVKDTETPEQQGSKAATSTGKSKVKDKETPKQQGSEATSTGKRKRRKGGK